MLKKIIQYVLLFISRPTQKPKIYSKFLGVKFGNNVRIMHYPRFGSEPYLIEIGNDVTITRGVCFVTHDGSVALFRKKYPGINVFGKIVVGSNVFIGVNSIILPGVTIGNNVVIGAGSVVNKSIPDNVVAAGVPAKIIKTIKEYESGIVEKAVIITSKNAKDRDNEIKTKYYANKL